MIIDWNCPSCGSRIQAEENQAGKSTICSQCAETAIVPLPDASDYQPFAPQKHKKPKRKRPKPAVVALGTERKFTFLTSCASFFRVIGMLALGLAVGGAILLIAAGSQAGEGAAGLALFWAMGNFAGAAVFCILMFAVAGVIDILIDVEHGIRRCAVALEASSNPLGTVASKRPR